MRTTGDISKNQVLIRLTRERWRHITSGHPEMKRKRGKVLDAIANPDLIVESLPDALIAVKYLENGKALMVV